MVETPVNSWLDVTDLNSLSYCCTTTWRAVGWLSWLASQRKGAFVFCIDDRHIGTFVVSELEDRDFAAD